MYEKTKLKNYDKEKNDYIVQIHFNGETLIFLTECPVYLVAQLKRWFKDKIGDWYNHTENTDLFYDLANYFKRNYNTRVISGWRVYPYDNIQKEDGFKVVLGEDGAIDVDYFTNVVRINPCY